MNLINFFNEASESIRKSEDARILLSTLFKQIELNNPSLMTSQELNRIADGIELNIPPESHLWRRISAIVLLALPNGFTEKSELAEQIHIFRYIISQQQINYIRKYYLTNTQDTDLKALSKYIQNLPAESKATKQSARLHNKCIDYILPNGEYVYEHPNKKILINFHSEFVLDYKGRFLSVFDEASINAVVNGASFNYAFRNDLYKTHLGTDSIHNKYDVSYGKYDPLYRTECITNIKNNRNCGKSYTALSLNEWRGIKINKNF